MRLILPESGATAIGAGMFPTKIIPAEEPEGRNPRTWGLPGQPMEGQEFNRWTDENPVDQRL